MSNTPSPASSVSSSSRPQVIPDDDTTFASLPIRNVIFPCRTGRPSNSSRFLHAFLTDVVNNNVNIPSNLIRPLFGYLDEFNRNVIPALPLPLRVQLQTLFDEQEILSLPTPPYFGTTCASSSSRGPHLSQSHRTQAHNGPSVPQHTIVQPPTNVIALLPHPLPRLTNATAQRLLTQCPRPLQWHPLAFLRALLPPSPRL
jgi:hypothetical protein